VSDDNFETYRFGRFWLCPSRHTLYLADEEIILTPKSYDVLLYLARNPGRVVTKEELLKAVWSDSYIEEGNLSQQVFRLRKAFEVEPGAAHLIRTVSGRGYQFTAEVSRAVLPTTIPEPVYPAQAPYAFEHFRERTRVVVEEYSSAIAAPQAQAQGKVTVRGIAIGAAAAILAVLATSRLLNWRRAHALPQDHHEIVLADFENRTGDNVFDFVLKNALAIDLQQSPELTVLPAAQVKSTLKQMVRSPDEPLTRSLAVEVCERSGDKAVLTGAIARLDRNYVVSLDATDCRTGAVFAALQSQAPDKDAVLQSLGDIDARMRARLGESLRSIQGFDVPIERATTASFDALVAYSRGVALDNDSQAIPWFQRAIQLDPNFALAWRKLGVCYENLGDVPAAKQAYTRAYQLRAPTSAIEQYLITSHYVDFVQEDMETSIRDYRTWIATYPDLPNAWAALANTQTLLGRYDEAIESARHGRSAHPNWYFYFTLSSAYLRASQLQAAETICREGIAAFPENEILHRIMEEIAFDTHDTAEYNRQVLWSHNTGTEYQTLDQQAREAAASGRLKAAETLFNASRAATEKQKLPAYLSVVNADQALAEALLGEPKSAAARAALVPPGLGEPSFIAAYAAAFANDLAYTQKVVDQTTEIAPPSSTLARSIYLPILRAALELQKNHPARAVDLLEPVQPYQLRDLDFPWLLGAIYLQARQPAEAAAQYQKILDNPGIDAKSPMYPLAHLGLARACAMQNKSIDSRAQYEQLFTLWRSADPDLPILKQARLEYAHLPQF